MKKHLQLTSLLIFILFYNANAQSPQNNPSYPTWKSLADASYFIQYPDSWDLDRSGAMGLTFMILSKQTSAQDQFRENVNSLIQDLGGQNIDLHQFVELTLGQVKTMLTNSQLIKRKTVINRGMPFQHLLYAGEINQQQLKFKQYYWIH